MALVCPLSNITTWQYVEQELNSNNYSFAMVRIISPPGIVPLMTVPHAYATETGGPSTLVAPQGPTLQRATRRAIPTRVDGAPPIQPQLAPLHADLMNSNTGNTTPITIAGGQNALSNGFVEDWDFSRPGFNS
jgi:hypothetical protein